MEIVTVETITQLVMAVGMLSFTVSVIVEVIKNLKFLKGVPTDFVVMAVSAIVTTLAVAVYASQSEILYVWYLPIAAIIGSFFVAFITMYGWDKMRTLYDRFNGKSITNKSDK